MSANKRKAIHRKFLQPQFVLEYLKQLDSDVDESFRKRFYELQRTDRGWQELFGTLASFCSGFKTVLDVGCGGYELLAVRNDDNAVGVDICKATLKMLRKKGFKGQVIQAACQHLPFTCNAFDCVISNQLIEHMTSIASIRQTVNEMERASNNIMIVTPNSVFRRRIYDPTHFFFFTTRSLQEHLPNFKIYASQKPPIKTLNYYLLYSSPRLTRMPLIGNLIFKFFEKLDSSKFLAWLNKKLWVGTQLIALKRAD